MTSPTLANHLPARASFSVHMMKIGRGEEDDRVSKGHLGIMNFQLQLL